jgi:flagellar hook assembly protein FlgD
MRRAGRHQVRWDGRNAAGRAVPGGIYYLRFATEGASSSRKLVKIE